RARRGGRVAVSGRSMRQRIALTAILFGVVFAGLAARAVQLTVLDGAWLKQRADRQHHQQVPMTAQRGAILDRSGEPLVLSRESAAVYLRPRELAAGPETLRTVARLLDLPQDYVVQRAAAAAPFVWLRRQVPLDRWTAIEDMKVPGIGSQPARQRVYPHGPLAGQVLGFTGVDGHGLEGIERARDAELQGEVVEAVVVGHDARGRRFELDEEMGSLPRAGAEVELTIDAGLQRVAEAELERAVATFQAKAGTVVVLDPHTGEVLAMATVPRFDPNQFAAATAAQYRNRAITDVYEPGSTFKAMLAASALTEGVVRPEERISCENGRYPVGRRTIRDAHPHGILSFADVIAQSSNIGCAKIAERLGNARFNAAIEQFGFGRPTGIDLPGEAPGMLRPVDKWGRIHLITTAFGQGIAVTPLQLTRAFAAIANGGRLMRPYTVRRVTAADGTVAYTGRPHVDGQVLSPQTAAAVTSLLVRVTEAGTGKQARIEGFTVAGKTGTAQKVENGRYHPRDRMSSFIGYVPAENPALVILAVVDSPRTATYGGVVAAPIFRAVAEYGLARRGILPRAEAAQDLRFADGDPTEDDAALLPIEAAASAIAVPGGVPSFLGLSMREALVRAHSEGWEVRVEGSGYVTAQDPPPGVAADGRSIALRFGSTVS
ncbi:MAG: penicillin-binding transpeptidase domain-containing protein, partial [Candidatus Binatia bacterium]